MKKSNRDILNGFVAAVDRMCDDVEYETWKSPIIHYESDGLEFRNCLTRLNILSTFLYIRPFILTDSDNNKYNVKRIVKLLEEEIQNENVTTDLKKLERDFNLENVINVTIAGKRVNKDLFHSFANNGWWHDNGNFPWMTKHFLQFPKGTQNYVFTIMAQEMTCALVVLRNGASSKLNGII